MSFGMGNGNPNAVFTESLRFADDKAPMLALNYSLGQQDGEEATVRNGHCELTIDANGGADDSFVLIKLDIHRFDQNGTALGDISYDISGVAAGGKVEWDEVTDDNWTAKASTLKEAIDLLNEVPGIQAWALDAPHWADLGSDNFIDFSVAAIESQPGRFTKCLYRDVSDYLIDTDKRVAWLRVGLPEARDAGSMRIIKCGGTITGATSGKVMILRDDIRDYGKEYNATYATQLENQNKYLDATAVETTLTNYIDKDILDAETVQGPIILQVTSTDMSAQTLALKLMQATF